MKCSIDAFDSFFSCRNKSPVLAPSPCVNDVSDSAYKVLSVALDVDNCDAESMDFEK